VLSGVLLFILDRRAGHATGPGVARYIERFSPNTITAVLGGVVIAWQFLVRVAG
jgi:hypothetical protein